MTSTLIHVTDGSAETSKEGTLPRGVGEAVNEASSRSKILQVVLVSPQVRLEIHLKLRFSLLNMQYALRLRWNLTIARIM